MDTRSNKILCVCIRVYEETSEQIVTTFLGLAYVDEPSREGLFESVKALLVKNNTGLKNCICCSSEGASNMKGKETHCGREC